jgi:hypothetical protein
VLVGPARVEARNAKVLIGPIAKALVPGPTPSTCVWSRSTRTTRKATSLSQRSHDRRASSQTREAGPCSRGHEDRLGRNLRDYPA